MRLILQLCLCILVLQGARTSSWGRMACHEPATTSQAFIRVSETDPDAPPMGVSSGDWFSHDATGFEDGPNLYAYVKQNPWTGWDPHGLEEKKKHDEKLKFTPAEPQSNNKSGSGNKSIPSEVDWSKADPNKQEKNPGPKSAKTTQTEQERALAEVGESSPASIKELDGWNKAINAERRKGEGMVLEAVGWGIAIAEPGPLGEEFMLSRAAAKSAPGVRLNIFGAGEARGFLDVSTNMRYANGRPLTSGLADGIADDIFIRSSPVSGENTISEIMRLSKSGTRVTVLEGAGGGQGTLLKEAFGDAAETTLQRSFKSQTYVPGTELEMLKLKVK